MKFVVYNLKFKSVNSKSIEQTNPLSLSLSHPSLSLFSLKHGSTSWHYTRPLLESMLAEWIFHTGPAVAPAESLVHGCMALR